MVKHEIAERHRDLPDSAAPDGAAWLCIDVGSQEVVDYSPAACELLGCVGRDLRGEAWQELLQSRAQPDVVLTRALKAAVRTVLPPFIVCLADGTQKIVGGRVLPREIGGGTHLELSLREVHTQFEYELIENLNSTDTLAVLGVDQLEYRPHWSGSDTARMMMDIRSSLLDILRTEDTVGMPVGSAIMLVLRDSDVKGAKDISRALLSHIRSILLSSNAGAGELQLCVGLAQVSTEVSPLRALLGANRALLQAQHNSGLEPIKVAQESDDGIIANRAINANGVFSDNRASRVQRQYLARLLQLVADNSDPESFPRAVVELTVSQRGVSALAIYQRRRGSVFEYVAGGIYGESGCRPAEENELPRHLRDLRRRVDNDYLEQGEQIGPDESGVVVLPLSGGDNTVGYLMLQHSDMADERSAGFTPDAAAMHALAIALSALRGWRESPAASVNKPVPVVTPVETGIEGYVGDNMEGAVDQAMFMAQLDVPVAIIGPRGTGKMYVAKVIHQESGAAPDMLVEIDCREFHSRKQADTRISRELRQGEGKTLVFKSPHLMNSDAQVKLARQISTRTLADVSPPRYLPRVKLIALFPDRLEQLIRQERLTSQLASAFAGYPIKVPPIKDRKQAVLRWAHKILSQECALRERYVRGFTPDAEQAMLQHDWPGNISEMRQCIVDALDKTDKEWISPVDLGIFKGISPDGASYTAEARPFLEVVEEDSAEQESYVPSAFEALDVALGEAVNNLLALNLIKPIGTWLEDEIVLAVCERYGNDMPGAAEFLHTKSRNISRWLPKIQSREEKRNSSALWQESRRLIKQWIREAAQLSEAPLQLAQNMLMSHVTEQAQSISVADRARIMGVSTPTYHKRLQEVRDT